MKVLTLNYEQIEEIIMTETGLRNCLQSLEDIYRDYGLGKTANRTRSHTYIPLLDQESPEGGRFFYHLKTLDGGSIRGGVMALRIHSGLLHHFDVAGIPRREYYASVETEHGEKKWLEWVLLFSVQDGRLLAVMPGGLIQSIRVGLTSALGSKYMAKEGAQNVGLFGAGWQARAQLLAHRLVRPIRHVKIYSVRSESRERFASEMERMVGVDIQAVNDPKQVLDGVDLVLAATTSYEPVFKAEWLTGGMHLTYIASGEVDMAAVRRADRIAIHTHLGAKNYWTDAGDNPAKRFAERYVEDDIGRYPQLSDLILDRYKGRTSPDEITCFVNNQGTGIQFAAVAGYVYETAKKKGIGRLETRDHLLQPTHP
jgi:ornithine cyclodeaminase/alanine dehydrogenase-like protein (mu-crystallin family)